MHEETGLTTPVGTRRRLFKWMTAAAMSLVGFGLGIPLVGYVISPAFTRREQSWVEVGKVEDLPVQQPMQLSYVASVQDGYVKTTAQKAVWAVKKDNGEVTAYSPQCTISVAAIDGKRPKVGSSAPAMLASLASMEL